MKKQIVIAIILGLAAAAACAQSAKLTAPKSGESWAQDTSKAITWTWNGAASIKLMLFSQSGGSIGAIKSGLALNAGSFTWMVGTLENGKKVPAGSDYKIRILTVPDNTLLAIGPAFSIIAAAQPGQPGEPAPPQVKTMVLSITQLALVPSQPQTPTPIMVKVTQPAKGTVWIPLKTNYELEWEWTISADAKDKGGWLQNCAGCPVHVWMVPAAAPSQKILLASYICCGSGLIKNGLQKYAGDFKGFTPSLASGDYFFRVSWSNNQSFYGDSPPFAVKSVISDDSAYLGPDPLQGEMDLALNDVFFDADGNLALKIKNLGQSFSGGIPVNYEQQAVGNYNKLLDKGVKSINLTIGTNEEKNVTLFKWTGYYFDIDRYTEGAYIPLTTRPFSIKVKISADKDSNPTNDSISKELCFIKEADIGTNGEIKLVFSPNEWVYIKRGTSNTVHEAKLKWLSKDTFEAEMEVVLWNYGGAKKSFDIWLYVDKLPGQPIWQGSTLQPGHRMTWKQPVKIKVPSRCGDHRLVFIVDPDEEKNQPYPHSYNNNFIPVTLKIICGGTVTGDN